MDSMTVNFTNTSIRNDYDFTVFDGNEWMFIFWKVFGFSCFSFFSLNAQRHNLNYKKDILIKNDEYNEQLHEKNKELN